MNRKIIIEIKDESTTIEIIDNEKTVSLSGGLLYQNNSYAILKEVVTHLELLKDKGDVFLYYEEKTNSLNRCGSVNKIIDEKIIKALYEISKDEGKNSIIITEEKESDNV